MTRAKKPTLGVSGEESVVIPWYHQASLGASVLERRKVLQNLLDRLA